MNKDSHISPLSPKELNHHHFGEGRHSDEYQGIEEIFHINRIENVLDKIHFPLPPHRKTVYDFFFLIQGESRRSKALQEYDLRAGTFFFLPANQISSHEYISSDSRGFFCHFSNEIFSSVVARGNFLSDFSFWNFSGNPIVKISPDLREPVNNILERLLTEYKSKRHPNLELISSYLLCLFQELKSVPAEDTNQQEKAAIRISEEYKHLLTRHIYTRIKVADYADLLKITPDHLNKCCKIATGITAQALLSEMILLEAKVLLKQTNLPVSEIAYRFSDTNASDFSRFFKKRSGMTPSEFREFEAT